MYAEREIDLMHKYRRYLLLHRVIGQVYVGDIAVMGVTEAEPETLDNALEKHGDGIVEANTAAEMTP